MKAPCLNLRPGPAAAVFSLLLAAAAPASAAQPDVAITGFKMVQDQGNKRWEILAKEAVYDGETSMVLSTVEARLLDPGVGTLTVTGDRGRYHSDTRILRLEGRISATTLSGYTFEADWLEWRGVEAVITAHGGVRLGRSFFSVRGPSLTHRTDSGRTVMTGGIKASWTPGKGRP